MKNPFKDTIKSVFLRVVCPRCRNKQIIFGRPSMPVKCKKCNYLLIKPRGGKGRVRAQVKEILE